MPLHARLDPLVRPRRYDESRQQEASLPYAVGAALLAVVVPVVGYWVVSLLALVVPL